MRGMVERLMPAGYHSCPGCHQTAVQGPAGSVCHDCKAKGVNPSSREHQPLNKGNRTVGDVVRGGRMAAERMTAPGAPLTALPSSGSVPPAAVSAPGRNRTDPVKEAKRRGAKPPKRASEQREMSPAAARGVAAKVAQVEFTLDGLPVPKERARTFTREEADSYGNVSRKTVTITPEDTKRFESEVGLVSAQARKKVSGSLLPGLLHVRIRVWCEESAARADIDNIAKAILDGMQGAVYANDNCVDRLEVERDRFHTGRPYARVVVMPFVPPSRR